MTNRETYIKEIIDRGGETEIKGAWQTWSLQLVDEQDGLALLRADGWRQYSRRFGARRASIAYLCGIDDNGPWAVRVAGTIETVADAVIWVEPAPVRKAKAAGKPVDRQGDVYILKTTKRYDGSGDLPPSHKWDPETRTLIHTDPDRPHKPVRIDYYCRFVAQRAYGMGRGAGAGFGD